LVCELTVKDGKIVYDLNAIEFDKWDAPKHTSNPAMAGHWTTFNERPFGVQTSTRWPSWSPPSQRKTVETGPPDIYNMRTPPASITKTSTPTTK
jgi:dihydroorotase